MQFDMKWEGADTVGASGDGLSDKKPYGFGFDGQLMKRGRDSEPLNYYYKDFPATVFSGIKMMKTDNLLHSKPMPSQTRKAFPSSSSFSDGLLGAPSLPKPGGDLLNIHDSLQTTAFSSFRSLHTKVTGLSSSNLSGNLHGVPIAFGKPFSHAQFLELEHQVLIYKHLAAGVPVPPNLLLTIKKTLGPSPPSVYSAASLAPDHVSWRSVNLPFSGNGDPEPGRCRRTDGKKWRCAREAVTDQKYCERHLNRGRHRSSRKSVEGRTSHTTSGKGAASVRIELPSASFSSPSPASDSLYMKQPQVKSSNALAASNFNRLSITKSNSNHLMPYLSSSSIPCSLIREGGSPSAAKQQFSYQHSSRMEIGFNSSQSLLYNAQSNSYLQQRATLGGPLAEVLNSANATNNFSMEAKNSSALNLIAQAWDANSHLESSPTGVLQKTVSGTLSCSSAGSCPRPETGKLNED